MTKFKLCYKVPNTKNAYIAPQLLKSKQPEYEWDSKDNLTFRYSYEFMPKGILSKFIVSLNRHIEGHKLVWKNGVVLHHRDYQARAEIIEYYSKREIGIKVSGIWKRDFRTVIMHVFDEIHQTYKGLSYKKLIPCNCEKCKLSTNPNYYEYDILQKFLNDREPDIMCVESYKMVNVLGLVSDVFGTTDAEYNEGGQLLIGTPDLIFNAPIKNLIYQPEKEIDMREKNINVDGDATVQGNLVVADKITNSLNNLSTADLPQDIKNWTLPILRSDGKA
jgi:hypothetical protein